MFNQFNFPTVSLQFPARRTSPLRRFSTALPMLAILAAAAFFTLSPVQAQVPQQLSQQSAFIDPPGRVARMNLAEGPVSFAPAGTSDPRWTPAVLNRPLTTGEPCLFFKVGLICVVYVDDTIFAGKDVEVLEREITNLGISSNE